MSSKADQKKDFSDAKTYPVEDAKIHPVTKAGEDVPKPVDGPDVVLVGQEQLQRSEENERQRAKPSS